jgi:hypothetical protein
MIETLLGKNSEGLGVGMGNAREAEALVWLCGLPKPKPMSLSLFRVSLWTGILRRSLVVRSFVRWSMNCLVEFQILNY